MDLASNRERQDVISRLIELLKAGLEDEVVEQFMHGQQSTTPVD